MASLAELQARLEELKAQRASGVREAQFMDNRVVYRSDAELSAAIADLERQVAQGSGRPAVKMVHFSTSKGI